MGKPLRALIVEDSEDDALLLVRTLRKGGYDVVYERVETPGAMNAALDRQWDLVIADYALPVFSGLDALKILRERKIDLPFIIVSGNIGEDIAVGAMRTGAHDYIMKGHLKRLIPAVERELREAEVRRERRRAEEQLKASSLYTRSLIEASLDPLVTISPEGKVTDVNRATEQVTGFTRDRLIGTDFSNFFTEPEKAQAGYRKALDEGLVRDYPLTIRHVSGRMTHVLYNATVYRDGAGEVRGVFAAARDITRIRRAEETQARLAAIVESSDDAILGEDLNGNIISWNMGAEKIYGYTQEETVGKSISLLLPHEIRDETHQILEKIARGEVVDHYETVRVRKDNRRIHVSLTVSPILDAEKRITGASIIARDVTERKRAEAKLKAYTTMLEQSNRDLDDFAHVAAHDLQEPLRKIQTFADLLTTMNRESLDDRARDYLERMQGAAGRMRALVQDLLRYSRATSRPEPFAVFNLKSPIQEAVTDLGVLCEESGARIEVGELPDITGDRIQMRQLFQNLIGNALKYRGELAPLVMVRNVSPASAQFWEIHVQDNGIGFDEEYLDKIFKPFQRLHARNSSYSGMGMGLAICRRIVERHGGSITARSRPWEGSTFIVRLPKKQ